MVRRPGLISLSAALLAAAIALSGCELFRSTERVSPDLPEAVAMPALTECEDSDSCVRSLLDQAGEHAKAGRELMEQGKPDEGRAELEQAFVLLGRAMDIGTDDEQLLVDMDKLLMDVCTDMLRVKVVVGGVGPKLGDKLPMDFVFNADVESWLLYFLTNGRTSMSRWLERSAAYRQAVEAILVEEGLPKELAALPIIESGYSPFAVSPASAVGLWQFIPSTGKRYGLIITNWVDERRDPFKGTRAACQYLKFLHDRFNSWPLALAGYNCGEGCVDRAVAEKGSSNYWNLALPWETQAYVPKFYAAMLIMSDPAYYGFASDFDPPIDYFEVKLQGVVDLELMSSACGMDYGLVKNLNPEVLTKYSPPDLVPYTIRIPSAHEESFKTVFWSMGDERKYLATEKVGELLASGPSAASSGSGQSRVKIVYHTVKRGESLWSIARKYGVSVDDLRKWNRSARGKHLRPGTRLKIQVRR